MPEQHVSCQSPDHRYGSFVPVPKSLEAPAGRQPKHTILVNYYSGTKELTLKSNMVPSTVATALPTPLYSAVQSW